MELVENQQSIPPRLYLWPEPGGIVGHSLARSERSDAIERLFIKTDVLDKKKRDQDSLLSFPESQERRTFNPRQLLKWLTGDIVTSTPIAGLGVSKYRLAIPAVNRDSRRQYQTIIRECIRGAVRDADVSFLYEPDAVLQYFRLVRRSIQPESREVQVYLIVDAGAGTTDFSVVFKPKTLKATQSTSGKSRGPLQPVTVAAPLVAGNWVDELLLRGLLNQVLPSTASNHERRIVEKQLSQHIEPAKCKVASTAEPCELTLIAEELSSDSNRFVATLYPRDLQDAARSLWRRLDNDLSILFTNTFERLSKSKRYNAVLTERGIESWQQIPKLFSYVILAGGTSLLPGFRTELEQRLSGSQSKFLSVGEDYTFAVAAGLAAHAIEEIERRATTKRVDKKEADVEPMAGIARLHEDISLVLRRGDREVLHTVVTADTFPIQYSDDYDPPASLPINPPRAKRPKGGSRRGRKPKRASTKLSVGLSYASLDRKELLPTERLLLLDNGQRWRTISGNKVDGKILACPRYNHRDNALEVHLYSLDEAAGKPESSKLLVTLRYYLDDPNAAAEDRSSTKRITDDDSVCIDIGTSKITCFSTVDGLRIHGLNISQELEPEHKLESGNGTEQSSTSELTIPVASEAQEQEVVTVVPPVSHEHIAFTTNDSKSVDGSPGVPTAERDVKADVPPQLQQRWTARHWPLEHPAETCRVDSVDELQFLREIIRRLREVGFDMPSAYIVNMHLSLKVAPFVLLTGPSGIGKTALARLYCECLGATGASRSLARVHVEARWTDSHYLLGELHGEQFHAREFLHLAYRSTQHEDDLFFAILDECNLAHMEYYLAPILSAMADDGSIAIEHAGPDRSALHLLLPLIPPKQRFFLIGTMNVDETTTLPADKIIDRVSIIELPVPPPPQELTVARIGDIWGQTSVLSAAAYHTMCSLPQRLPVAPEIHELWNLLSTETTPGGAHVSMAFGRRVANDMAKYLFYADQLATDADLEFSKDDALDFLVLQKILPRIRGESSLEPLLKRLQSEFCEKYSLKRSQDRLARIQAQLKREHATSFWTS